MPDDERPGEAAIEDQLRQARQALADADGARDAELSDAVVINRLYYACFHVAQAVLYDRGYDPSTHGGVRSCFGSEVVVFSDASRKDGRFLNDLVELCKRADYGYGTIDEDLDSLLARPRQFVARMESVCSIS